MVGIQLVLLNGQRLVVTLHRLGQFAARVMQRPQVVIGGSNSNILWTQHAFLDRQGFQVVF